MINVQGWFTFAIAGVRGKIRIQVKSGEINRCFNFFFFGGGRELARFSMVSVSSTSFTELN